MTTTEIRAAIKFGEEAVREYKENGNDTVPMWVYDRMIELYEKLAEALSIGE